MKPLIVGNKIYGVCPDCLCLIRLNKPLLGSWHLCLTEDELKMKRQLERSALERQQISQQFNEGLERMLGYRPPSPTDPKPILE